MSTPPDPSPTPASGALAPESRVVLITGASSGFGRMAAEQLAARGHVVYAGLREMEGRNAPAAEEMKGRSADGGLELYPVAFDVTDPEGVKAVVDRILAEAGGIDAVIQTAAIVRAGPVEAFRGEEFLESLDTNVVGAQRVIHAVLPAMRAQGRGLVLNVSAWGGRVAIPLMGIYNATKWALEGLTESLHFEARPLGIDVTLLEPGNYPTGIQKKIGYPDDRSASEFYKDAKRASGHFFRNLNRITGAGTEKQDPQEVVDAMIELVEMAPGDRPLRRLVGTDAQVAAPLNEAADALWRELLTRP